MWARCDDCNIEEYVPVSTYAAPGGPVWMETYDAWYDDHEARWHL